VRVHLLLHSGHLEARTLYRLQVLGVVAAHDETRFEALVPRLLNDAGSNRKTLGRGRA
jgi:hypothetical protein